MRKRVLIVGGTGVFGKRLARHLAQTPELSIIITSRSETVASRVADEIRDGNQTAIITGVALDHRKGFDEQLNRIDPWAVVDCSGPFQGIDYDVARTVISSGIHMIDLADARDYLLGYREALDDLARQKAVVAMAGASSSPTLSAAVVHHLTQDWQRIDTIDMAITPGGKSEVGQSVIAAILTYVGKPVPVWRLGRTDTAFGWVGSGSIRHPDLGKRRVAPVETADAEILGPLLGVMSHITFSAGLESRLEQYGIELLARLRKWRLFPDPGFLAQAFAMARRFTRLTTSDSGGMLVSVSGLDENGRFAKARWWLTAHKDHGPYVPVLPAAVAIRKLLNGDIEPGAHVADGSIRLPEITNEMKPYAIAQKSDLTYPSAELFKNALGEAAFRSLPTVLQRFHAANSAPVWTGRASVARARGPVIALISKLFGFPEPSDDVPITFVLERSETDGRPQERWTRHIGKSSFSSVLTLEPDGSLSECFTPFTFRLGAAVENGTVIMPVDGWRLGPLRLPKWLGPQSKAREYADEQGRYCFDVKLDLPVLGTLAHYKGHLEPALRETEAPSSLMPGSTL